MTAYAGTLAITWPACPVATVPEAILLTDTATGQRLDMVTRLVLDADCDTRLVTAELTIITQVEPRETRTERWLVGAMQVAP